MGKKIDFAGGRWIALSQAICGNIARRPERNLSSDLRLWLLAQWRMNDTGHAIFQPTRKRPDGTEEPGELRMLLGVVDRQGELHPLSVRQVYKLKNKLAAAGVLVDASGGETCVWVAHNVAQRAAGNTQCPHHKGRDVGYSAI